MKLVVGEHFLKPLGGGLGGTLERIVVHVHESEPFGVAAGPLCGTDSSQTVQEGYPGNGKFVGSIAATRQFHRHVTYCRCFSTTHRTYRHKVQLEGKYAPSMPIIASQLLALQHLRVLGVGSPKLSMKDQA